MHFSAFISTILPELALSASKTVTSARRATPTGHAGYPAANSTHPWVDARAYAGNLWVGLDVPVYKDGFSVCAQPVVTVTATVTTFCGAKSLGAGTSGNSKLNTKTAGEHASATRTWDSSSVTTTHAVALSKTTATWKSSSTKPATLSVSAWMVSSATFTITANRYSTTLTGVSGITEELHAATATTKGPKIGTSVDSHNWHGLPEEDEDSNKTKTTTVVDVHTKTRIHAHTTVPSSSVAEHGSSNAGAHPSETRLPEHPSIPAPITVADGTRTSHIASTTKSAGHHPSPTEDEIDPLETVLDLLHKINPEDDDDEEDEDEEDEAWRPHHVHGLDWDEDEEDLDDEEDYDDDKAAHSKPSTKQSSSSSKATAAKKPTTSVKPSSSSRLSKTQASKTQTSKTQASKTQASSTHTTKSTHHTTVRSSTKTRVGASMTITGYPLPPTPPHSTDNTVVSGTESKTPAAVLAFGGKLQTFVMPSEPSPQLAAEPAMTEEPFSIPSLGASLSANFPLPTKLPELSVSVPNILPEVSISVPTKLPEMSFSIGIPPKTKLEATKTGRESVSFSSTITVHSMVAKPVAKPTGKGKGPEGLSSEEKQKQCAKWCMSDRSARCINICRWWYFHEELPDSVRTTPFRPENDKVDVDDRDGDEGGARK